MKADRAPVKRGTRGPRPGALASDDLESVIEYALQIPIKILANVLEYQRVVTALSRRQRRAIAAGDDFEKRLRADESALAAHALAKLIRRTALVGRSPKIATWGDREPSTSVDGMLSDRMAMVPPAAALMARSEIELHARLKALGLALVANAKALRRGFGEQGRGLVLGHRIEAGRAVLRALHPRLGTKKLNSLLAANLGFANESVLRNRDKRAKGRRS